MVPGRARRLLCCTVRRSWPRAPPPHASQPGRLVGRRPRAAPILLTTFNGNLAEALQAQADLLIRDPAVRGQIQVSNVDRLAYSIVKEARGTPVIADERVLRARWAEAAAAFGLDLNPGLPQERVGAGHPGPGPAQRAGVPDLPADRPGTAAHQGAAQPGLAGRSAGHCASWPLPASPPTCSWPTRPRTCSGRRSAALPAHPGGRGPGPACRAVAAAPRSRHRRPGRPVHRGRPAPAHLPQPGLAGQPADQRARAEPEAVPELPHHPGDPGLGDAAARFRSGHRPGR